MQFERIYFRGANPEIYKERKALGRLLVPQIFKSINFDLKNTIFFIYPQYGRDRFSGHDGRVEDFLVSKKGHYHRQEAFR